MRYVNPTNDLAFKKVLGSNENVHILAGFIRDFFSIEPKELVIENPYSIRAYKEQLHDKEINRLRATVSDIAATMNFADYKSELQLRRSHNFDERSLYYPLDKYVSRYKVTPDSPSAYARLRPVYVMNILGFNHFNEDEDALRIFELYDPARNKKPKKSMLHIGYFELLKPQVETQNQRLWQDYFLQKTLPANAPSYMLDAQQILERANMDEEELNMITRTEYLQSIYDDQMAYATDEGRALGLAEGRELGLAQGREIGLSQGLEQGLSQGLSQGHTQALTSVVLKLLGRNRPLEEIIDLTGCNKEFIDLVVQEHS